MVILVDANIVLDVLLKREPYRTNAEVILSKCAGRQIIGYLVLHCINNQVMLCCQRHTLISPLKWFCHKVILFNKT